jgi:hypothetical protein
MVERAVPIGVGRLMVDEESVRKSLISNPFHPIHRDRRQRPIRHAFLLVDSDPADESTTDPLASMKISLLLQGGL